MSENSRRRQQVVFDFLKVSWTDAAALTRIKTSPRPISGTEIDSTSTTLAPLYTAAFMVVNASSGKQNARIGSRQEILLKHPPRAQLRSNSINCGITVKGRHGGQCNLVREKSPFLS